MIAKKWLILYLGTLMHGASVSVVSSFGIYALYLDNVSAKDIGLIIGVANIGPIFTILLWSKIINKYGERNIITLGMMSVGTLLLMLSFTNKTCNSTLFFAFIISLIHGIAQAGGSAIVMKWFDKNEKSIAFGIRQCGTPIGLGMSAGLLPSIIEKMDICEGFYIHGLFCIILSIAFYLLYRTSREYSVIEGNTQEEWKLSEIIKNKTFIKWSLYGFIMTSFQFIISGYLMLYLKSQNISIVQAGMIMLFVSIMAIPSRIILPLIDKKYLSSNNVKVLFLCILISGISSICIAHFLFLSLLLISIFGFGWFGMYLNLITESTAKRNAHLANSTSLTINQIAISFSPMLFGGITSVISFKFSWTLLGLGLIAFAIKIIKNKS